MAEFGEYVMYLPAASVGRNNFDVRWMDGVWLAIKLENGVSIKGQSRQALGSAKPHLPPPPYAREKVKIGAAPRNRRA